MKFDAKISDYKKVSITLKTEYEWGQGWPTLVEKRAFQKEVYSKMEDAGFNVVQGNISVAAPEIRGPGLTSLYLHPMKFTGYMKKPDLDRLLEVLETCETIYEIEEVKAEDVYSIDDSHYRRILTENILLIKDWIDKNKDHDGFTWAKQNRIPRVGDKSLYMSSDTDIEFVNNFIKMKKLLQI